MIVKKSLGRISARLEAIKYEKKYSLELEKLSGSSFRAIPELAVVVHLYYVDNWPLFLSRLSNLSDISFDLFITIPEQNINFSQEIHNSFPGAHIITVPNRGRDVLPFVKVAQALERAGYKYVLKFHSKKSTHWDGGQDWLEGMIERLLPDNPRRIKEIVECLKKDDTGIVGPADVYYPLTINFPANGAHMNRVISRVYGVDRAYEVLQTNRANYGFFGGTMFWARLDAIKPLLNSSARQFEPEKGQIDATFAHALERLFCVVPEMENKKLYELTMTKLRPRPYRSNNIPDWSQDHDK